MIINFLLFKINNNKKIDTLYYIITINEECLTIRPRKLYI